MAALLRDDGTLLTEFTAIAFRLARSVPNAKLTEAEARALELLDFITASLHMRGFTLFKVPQKFSADPAVKAARAAHGRAEAYNRLAELAARLATQDYVLGEIGIAASHSKGERPAANA